MNRLEELLKAVEQGSDIPRWWSKLPADAQEFLTVLKNRAENGNTESMNVSKIVSILKDEWDIKISYSAIRRYLQGDTYVS
jgi:transposase